MTATIDPVSARQRELTALSRYKAVDRVCGLLLIYHLDRDNPLRQAINSVLETSCYMIRFGTDFLDLNPEGFDQDPAGIF